MSSNKTKTIQVDYLARVEGEGALYVKTVGKEVKEVRFKIFEPPRFFEAFLRGRRLEEAPDLTARICGICPVAYQMSSVHAMENALGIQIPLSIRELRRLLYCGEWIESHTLHIYLLHAPDFLGFEDAIQMSKQHPGVLERGLRLKKVGNRIGQLLGGREVHPINIRVGGFYKTPSRLDLRGLLDELKWARDAAFDTLRWAAQLPIPDFQRDYEFVSLVHPSEYPMNEGRLVSNRGLNIAVSEYEQSFEETHVEHTHALHSHIRGRGNYFVGPLARYNLNFKQFSPLAKQAAQEAKLGSTCQNPFQSILIRSIEVLYACDEAIRIIENYQEPQTPSIAWSPREATGTACTEAPRGILYHRYQIDEEGIIREAKIVPPTSQNQATIESDLFALIPRYIDLKKSELQWKCEQAIRNYDPCISCATHFLKLNWDQQ